jgi:hypothetical protein
MGDIGSNVSGYSFPVILMAVSISGGVYANSSYGSCGQVLTLREPVFSGQHGKIMNYGQMKEHRITQYKHLWEHILLTTV